MPLVCARLRRLLRSTSVRQGESTILSAPELLTLRHLDKGFTNKEIAVELKADGRVFGLGYHHGGDDGYWTENQGAVNRDFTRVAFNSNWSTGSQTDVDDYLIQLEPGMIPAAQ